MVSKFPVPIDLLNITVTPASPDAGFVSLYMKSNFLTTLSSSGVELDVVLDRPLTGFQAVTPAPLLATDTVLEAFEKLQAQLNTISSGQPDEYYQDLIFGSILAGTGISVNYDDFANTFTISSTFQQGLLGSGTTDYLARWTPNGTTLGTSLIRDNGTLLSIGETFDNTVKFNVYQNGQLTTAAKFHNVGQDLDMPFTGVNFPIFGSVSIAENPNFTAIGGYFSAEQGALNYSLQLLDGTQGSGKFLKSVTSDGKANWATLTTSDISGFTAYTLPTASNSVLGGVKVGSGLSIDGSGVLSLIPSPTYIDTVFFDQLTPTTSGVVFSPNTPSTSNILYVSSVDSSTWIWNGSAYVTEPTAVVGSAWNLLNSTTDAGSNKTFPIQRSGAIAISNATASSAATNISFLNGTSLDIISDGTAYTNLFTITNTASHGSFISLKRLRGTRASLSHILNNDVIGEILFDANYKPGVILRSIATEDHINSNSLGASFYIATRHNGLIYPSDAIERFKITSTGAIKFNTAYTFPMTDGTINQVLSTDGAGNLFWNTVSGGGGIGGSGILNRVARWTPDGATLGSSIIQDNGTVAGINGLTALVDFSIETASASNTYGLLVSAPHAGNLAALWASAQATSTTLNTAIKATAVNSSTGGGLAGDFRSNTQATGTGIKRYKSCSRG
jgi:hypothetical protein